MERGLRMIDVTYRKAVAVVSLDRSVINALNLELVEELAGTLAKLKTMPNVRAIILTSANEKFFSIGFDIPRLIELSREDFREFYAAFNRTCMALYTLPKPTVAGITGHAIAGGCILALCCDYRVISAGRKLMGLNEIKLGVPVPYLADCVLRSIVGTRLAREVVEMGEFYESEVLLRMCLVDDVTPQAEVMAKTVEKAEALSSMPAAAYGRIKRNRTEEVEARVRAKWEEKQRDFIDMWYTEEARRRLREAMKSF
jgi:enoyl-CoA hydratase/carnithine racemase